MNDAIVLVSGGLDSATVLAIARDQGLSCHALSFDYGQRHRCELHAARRVAEHARAATHRVVTLDASVFGDTSLTGNRLDVPRDRADVGDDIPPTYVPARNLLFLSYGVAYAESMGAQSVHIGANALDFSGYPDCRPAFIESFARTAALATRAGVEGSPIAIEAPLVDQTKAGIIEIGIRLGVDYALTISCYDPDGHGHACGRCDSCALRRRGFEEAGVDDPTSYQDHADV